MNQTYIEYVKTAHKLCKEMKEIDANSNAFHTKANEYCDFVLKISEDNWRVGAYILAIALATNQLPFIAKECPAFLEFSKRYRSTLFDSSDEELRNKYLSEDLLYLRNIGPDQN